ncbi:MAG: hypothetical protein MIO92_05950 [Methanosarcinaceae archaeon]|nr:hypothetical protein [Methanosarcinaceae archaeon]
MTVKPFIGMKPELHWFDELQKHVDITKPVQVYRNLHKKCWSIRQNGKVRCHALYISMKDCKTIVGEKTRQRVLREKKKYVHAFVVGTPVHNMAVPFDERGPLWNSITYNPYIAGHFYVNSDPNVPVRACEYVDMQIGEDDPVLVWGEK